MVILNNNYTVNKLFITVNNYSRLGALKRVLHQALAARLVTMFCVGISSGRFLPRTHLQKQKKKENCGRNLQSYVVVSTKDFVSW